MFKHRTIDGLYLLIWYLFFSDRYIYVVVLFVHLPLCREWKHVFTGDFASYRVLCARLKGTHRDWIGCDAAQWWGAGWWLVGGGSVRFLRLCRAGLSGEDRNSNCGLRAGDYRSADTFRRRERGDVRPVVSSDTLRQSTVHVNSTFTRLYVRQSGLDVDNMSATNDIRTTRMHRMARRAVWRLFMNLRRGLKRECPRYNNMVKEKANSIRIYDSEGYRRRAACICVKNDLEDEVSQPADGSSRLFLPARVPSLVFSRTRTWLFFSQREPREKFPRSADRAEFIVGTDERANQTRIYLYFISRVSIRILFL